MGEHDHDGPDPRYAHDSEHPSPDQRPQRSGPPMQGAPARERDAEPAPADKPSQAEGER